TCALPISQTRSTSSTKANAARASPLAEPQAVDVCVTQNQAQSDRCGAKTSEARSATPAHDLLDLVAVDLVAVVQGEAGDRLAGGVLHFYANVSNGRCRVVEDESRPIEAERMGQ